MSTLFDQESKTTPETQTQEILVFAPEEKPVVSKFDMEQRVLEIVAVCTQAVAIKDDATNDYARQVGKNASLIVKAIDKKRLELNELPKKEIESNNAVAKKLSAPIETQIERLRLSVSTYELDKEKKRLAELKIIEDAKKVKEEAERKERERVQGIKQNILDTKNKAFSDIDLISDPKSLSEFEKRFNGWKPKEEYYAEFMGELTAVREEITKRIQSRQVIVAEIEKSRKEAEKLKGVAKAQAQKELELKKQQLDLEKSQADAKAKEVELEKQKAENKANQDLTIYLATLGVKEVPKRTEEFVQLFGSSVDAMNNKDKIVEKINAERISDYNSKNLKADKVKNQRTEYKFTILDETLVPREYLCVDETKIKKAIAENREALEKDLSSFQIAGVQIFPETKTVFK
jgi:hypothetical protein